MRAASVLGRLQSNPWLWRRLRAILLAVLIANGLFSLALLLLPFLGVNLHLKDTLAVYVVAWALRAGVDPALPLDRLAQQFIGPLDYRVFGHPTPHPPTLALLGLPLTLLPYGAVEGAWFVAQLLGLGLTAVLVGRLVGARWNALGVGMATIALIGWGPLQEDLHFANVNIFLLTCLLGLWLCLRRGALGWAGLLLGLSLLIKPLFWPLGLLLVLRRSWWPVAVAGAVAAGAYGLTIWLMGLDGFLRFVTRGMPATIRLYQDLYQNQSLWSVARAKVVSGTVYFVNPYQQPAAVSDLTSLLLSSTLPALVLLLVIWLTRRLSLDWALAVFVCFSMVGSPVAWYQYLAFAVVPVVLLVGWLGRRDTPPVATLVVGLLVLLLAVPSSLWTSLALAPLGLARPGPTDLVLPLGPTLLTMLPLAVALLLGAVTIVAARQSMTRPAHADNAPDALAVEVAGAVGEAGPARRERSRFVGD